MCSSDSKSSLDDDVTIKHNLFAFSRNAFISCKKIHLANVIKKLCVLDVFYAIQIFY